MKVVLSIKKYIGWIWIIEKNRDIRKEYKKLSDIPLTFLPKFVFVNENEFDEAVRVCCSTCSEEGMDNMTNGKDVDIEWLDDFDYQAKVDKYVKTNFKGQIISRGNNNQIAT